MVWGYGGELSCVRTYCRVLYGHGVGNGFRANPSTKLCHVIPISAQDVGFGKRYIKSILILMLLPILPPSTGLLNIKLMIFPSQFKISIARLDNRK